MCAVHVLVCGVCGVTTHFPKVCPSLLSVIANSGYKDFSFYFYEWVKVLFSISEMFAYIPLLFSLQNSSLYLTTCFWAARMPATGMGLQLCMGLQLVTAVVPAVSLEDVQYSPACL